MLYLKALVNEDTLLPMMFLGLRKLGNICCGHKIFLNKIRNIFCVPDTKFVSATNVARAGIRGKICVGNNVSATMRPRLPRDTLLPMMFLGLHKLGNICCGHRIFLNKIRNIFCVSDTKCKSATNVARAGKRGNICVGNNVSATMCHRLPGPLRHCYTDFSNHFDFVSRKKLFAMSKNGLR